MGGGMDTWQGFVTLWANVEPISGRERDMANQTESPRDYRFTVRRSSDSAGILAKDKITWRSKEFNVRFVALPDAKSQYMRIDAEEGVAV
jgi:SPP1 family predicted phage head-tail adaptor